jgi:exosortase/archaeosortase family protein
MSTQDKMRYGILPYAALSAGILITILSTLFATPLYISDTDPSTYVVVVLLMLVIFPLFYSKLRLNRRITRRDMALGITGYLAVIVMTFYLHFLYPEFFASFRLSLLLLPLAIASLVSILFGAENIVKFKGILLYSLLASPLILYPVFGLNQEFASLNTYAVYHMLLLFSNNVRYAYPTTVYLNGIPIGIGEACAGIGALIGLLMFLIPVAWLYEGGTRRKAAWVLAGVVLMLVLNLIRMAGIALTWAFLDIRAAVSFVHAFAGVFIFYISIIVMILAYRSFGLSFPASKRKLHNADNKSTIGRYAYALALLLPAVYFAATYPAAGYTYFSPIYFGHQTNVTFQMLSSGSMLHDFINVSRASGFSSTAVPFNVNGMAVVMLTNSTFNYTNPILLILDTRKGGTQLPLNFSTSYSEFYSDAYGREIIVSAVYSNDTEFFIASSMLDVKYNGSVELLKVFLVMPASVNALKADCNQDYVSSFAFEAFGAGQIGNSRRGTYAAYCITEKIIGAL